MRVRSEGSVVFVIVVIIVFNFLNYAMSEKAYDEGYEAAKEEYEYSEEEHASSCDGSCEHVEESIQNLIGDELIEKDSVYDLDDDYSEDELLQSYTEGLAEGYVQGYGDCFYGNKKELDISEYTDEEYYYE